MWHNHPFSQRIKAIERVVRVGVGGNRKVGGGQILKKGGGLGNIGGLHKIGGELEPLCQQSILKKTFKKDLKVSSEVVHHKAF